MNNTEITKVALKVFAVFVMVQAILIIPSFFQAYMSLSMGTDFNTSGWFITVSTISIALLFLLSFFVWRLSNKLATSFTEHNINHSSLTSESFILSILGLYLIFEAIKNFSISSVGLFYAIETSTQSESKFTQIGVYLLVYFIQFIIGLTLIIKTKGWLSVLNKLRVAGTK